MIQQREMIRQLRRVLLRATALAATLAAVVAGLCGAVHAQGVITADPNAAPLRLIWKVEGQLGVGGERIGEGAAGLGDIYGTGMGAWGVYYGTEQRSRIFRHDSASIAKDTAAVQTFDSLQVLLSGDFWGTGHRAVVFATTNLDQSGPRTKYYYELHIHRTEGNRIEDSAAVVFNGRLLPMKYEYFPDDVRSVDLDGDGADELVMVWGGTVADTGIDLHPELWIYRGGADFRLDSPTVIVRHPLLNAQVGISAQVGDFDGDHHPDIVISRSNGDDRDHLTFYWGTGDLADFGKPEHTRIVPLTDSMPDARSGLTALDCDGDSIIDLAFERGRGQPSHQGVYLFRSAGRVAFARTRTFEMNNADFWVPGYTAHRSGGFLNDRSRQFEMLAIFRSGFNPGDPSTMYLLSGGTSGPDSLYDAYTTSTAINLTIPMMDVDGDGWSDLLVSNFAPNFNGGIAAIFAGGPYIPGPKVSAVEAVAGEGHVQALTVWPNPVREELHIAWRGDLSRMPALMEVHDLRGREVARGAVEPWRGAALWRPGALPAGVYVLTVRDAAGNVIAGTRVIKL